MGNRKSTKSLTPVVSKPVKAKVIPLRPEARVKLGLRIKESQIGIDADGYPLPNNTPRQPTTLNDRQKRFAEEYVFNGLKPARAYEAAYGQQSTDRVAHESAYRLMRHVGVQEYIDKLKCSLLEKTELNTVWVVERWRLLYFACLKQHDSTGAARALIEIGKVLGIYEKHNRQKVQYSQSDVDRLKQELTEAGFDLSRLDPSEN